MASSKPARFGPFHRISSPWPDEIEKICASGEIRGKPRGNFYAAILPSVKAYEGPLPDDAVGVEFYTNAEPDSGRPPGTAEWTQGHPGVRTLEPNQLVAIDVIVTKRRDSETPR